MRTLSDVSFNNTETISYNSRRIEMVMKYLNNNFDKTVTLGEAARLAAMSEVAFSRFFKNADRPNLCGYAYGNQAGPRFQAIDRNYAWHNGSGL